jgi:anthranilate/para-aminobenzoate synthase component II
MFDTDFYIILLGVCLAIIWIVTEFGGSISVWWNTEIVADYPFEDDL